MKKDYVNFYILKGNIGLFYNSNFSKYINSIQN